MTCNFLPVMIAQSERKSISVFVFSMARVMISQWKNKCITSFVLSTAQVMIAHWERMYFSVRPLHGLSDDSSVVKEMDLAVCPLQ